MVIEMASEKTNPILHVEIQTDNKEKTLKDVLITENPDRLFFATRKIKSMNSLIYLM
ncbi:ATP-dependent RNA helicase dbpA [Listeria monocytogenes]|nr:ATP-dependent RNA helicase dbpA [Listeria monocytogenes]